MVSERFLRGRLARLLSPLFLASLVLTLSLIPATLRAQTLGGDGLPVTASLPTGSETIDAVSTPSPLDRVDADRYRQIFELQADGRWLEADEVIGRLTDLRLLGHVLADRYLSETYRTSYAELVSWLARFSDHPDSPRLYALALKRLPDGETPPVEPSVPTFAAARPTAAPAARTANGLPASKPGARAIQSVQRCSSRSQPPMPRISGRVRPPPIGRPAAICAQGSRIRSASGCASQPKSRAASMASSHAGRSASKQPFSGNRSR